MANPLSINLNETLSYNVPLVDNGSVYKKGDTCTFEFATNYNG